jgi:hypothetical protein
MNEQHDGQPQEQQTAPTRANGNGSQQPSCTTEKPVREVKQSSTPKSSKAERIDQPSIQKSTGPRTSQGKQRSKFNALKHGLYSKVVLLKDESHAEYDALLKELREDFQPLGTLEAVLVENLTLLLWRKRRTFQVESAEISKKDFLRRDTVFRLAAQHLYYARRQEGSNGILDDGSIFSIVREAMDMLTSVRFGLMNDNRHEGKNSAFTNMLLGADKDATAHDRFLHLWQEVMDLTAKFEDGKEINKDPVLLDKRMGAALDAEIQSLRDLYNFMSQTELLKIDYNVAAARIPPQEALDGLIRYEAHLSREFDRTLSQLERWQRMRKGQPVLPPIKVEVSS